MVDSDWFDRIVDPVTEEEQDMLDLAYGLTDTYVCRTELLEVCTPVHRLN